MCAASGEVVADAGSHSAIPLCICSQVKEFSPVVAGVSSLGTRKTKPHILQTACSAPCLCSAVPGSSPPLFILE